MHDRPRQRLGAAYCVNIRHGLGKEGRTRREQFEPDFLAISPNKRIPALVECDANGNPVSIFESGAILTYLADKHSCFLAPSGQARWAAQAWLFWQVGGLGPMMGQVGYFAFYAKEKMPAALDRYRSEVGRLLGVLEGRLSEAPYLVGDEYSIADMPAYPWTLGAYTRAKDVLVEQIADKPGLGGGWRRLLPGRPSSVAWRSPRPPSCDERIGCSSIPLRWTCASPPTATQRDWSATVARTSR